MTTQRESRPGGRAGGGGAWDKALGRATLSTPHYSTQHQTRKTVRHGKITGNTWRKVVRASVHQLRQPRAWCVDVDDLEAAERLGVEWLEICDLETGVTWSAPLSAFRRYGLEINRGFGRQIALPLAYWRHSKGEAEAAQLTLPLEVAP